MATASVARARSAIAAARAAYLALVGSMMNTLDKVARVPKVSREWLLHGHGDVEGPSPLMENQDDAFIPIPHAGGACRWGAE